ncbi:MAG: response regulator [Bacteroidota bacterium]|nr:response regulator [Bacteroidota bacterium]MDO9613309.1 response regulator [Bacteroidota bacterium]
MRELTELKILVAEDNRINQRIAILTFKQLGVSIDIASNGMEALEKYRKKQYDLILMDMQMPEMDGLEATSEIRTFEQESKMSHRAVIVALTGSEPTEKRDVCLEAGMNDYMEKPIQEKLLSSLMAKFFK